MRTARCPTSSSTSARPAASSCHPGRYYVSVDSGRDLFNGRSLAGPYVLRSWVNDVRPPNVTVLTKRVAAGRPTIVARVRDALSGVDPHSLTLFGRELGTQVGPISYDTDTGIAVFSIPREENPLRPGTEFMRVFASDFQETKNINTEGTNPYPNSRFAGVRMSVVNRPAVTWISPSKERVPRGARAAAGRRELACRDLVRRLLRRQPPDRAVAEGTRPGSTR